MPAPPLEVSFNELKHLVSSRALEGDTLLLNMGPQHPSTHGVLRLLLELEGETVINCIPDIGFLHTGIEKNMEAKNYLQALVMTDRMDYLNNIGNNLVYCLAIEKLVGLDVPPRAQAVRVILTELQRIASHLVWLATSSLDLAAMSTFLYCFREREIILDIFEMCSGQRMMTSYIRPGGIWRDLPSGFEEAVRQFLRLFPRRIRQYEALLTKNPLFLDRTRQIGILTAKQALRLGVTGPMLRATGVSFDLRKVQPYSGYEQYDFEVPTATGGDTYDRYLVRMEEINQSLRIIEQALAKLPKGDVIVRDRKVALPPKSEVYSNIESLMNHFKLVYDGILPPPGEVYGYTEGANGELGFYIVSDGRKHPWRVKVRPPCFAIYAAFPEMLKGAMIADAVAIIGGLNIIAGELDR